jgi:succinate dehydrogenase / fumarate reductase, iron-sulfur subunit
MGKTVKLRVVRQDGPHAPDTKRTEEFELPWEPQMNVISSLMAIQKNPVTSDGKKVPPVVWESACLEEGMHGTHR